MLFNWYSYGWKAEFAPPARKNWQDFPPVCLMISNHFDRLWLPGKKTRASEPIIGIFQKKMRGLIQEKCIALHPAGMDIFGGETVKQINSFLNGLIPESCMKINEKLSIY